jgi:hypothetical protein
MILQLKKKILFHSNYEKKRNNSKMETGWHELKYNGLIRFDYFFH